MPKDTYDTDVKRKVIEKQRNAIRKYLLRGSNKKSPSDLTVAFFPGKEALEYSVAYEPLGIPQENITAIERDNANYNYWKDNSTFKMTEKPLDARDFFSTYDGKPFDVISLDYDGMLGGDFIDTINDIVGRGILQERSVFSTNFYAKREQNSTKNLYRIASSMGHLSDINANSAWIPEYGLKIKKSMSIVQEFSKGIDLKSSRDKGITKLTAGFLTHFAGGKAYGAPSLYFIDPRHKEWEKQVEGAVKQGYKEYSNQQKVTEDEAKQSLREHFRAKFRLPINVKLGEYLETQGHAPILSSILHYVSYDRYFPEDIKTFSYTSDNGAVMNTDMFCLSKKSKLLKRFKKMASALYTPEFRKGPVPILDIPISIDGRAIMRKLKRYERELEKIAISIDCRACLENIPKRIYLGSSQKPLISCKKRLKEIVQSGLSVDEISDQYRLSKNVKSSLPAFVAHRTMKTYQDPIKEPKAEPMNNPGSSKNSKIPQKKSFQVIPRRAEKALIASHQISKNALLRTKYFEDSIRCSSENRRKQILKSLDDSKWFLDIAKKHPSDLQIYAFFDDVELNFVRSRKRVNGRKIRSLWDKILDSDTLYETVPLPEKKTKEIISESSKKKSPNGEENIYEYIKGGFSDEEIMDTFDLSKRQLGARKAWITMGVR